MSIKKQKQFARGPQQIRRLLPELGGGFASDRIMVDGMRVGVMYREEPQHEMDSGWCFLAGDEEEEYLDDPANAGVYALNTVANYDPSIIRFLTYPEGTRIERRGDQLVVVEGPDEPPELTFLPGIEAGNVRLTSVWSFMAAETMLRRVDADGLVLWRPGLTAFFRTCPVEGASTPGQEVARFLSAANDGRFDEQRAEHNGVVRARYRLDEEDGSTARTALHGIVATTSECLLCAVYFDDEDDAGEAVRLYESLTVTSAGTRRDS